MLRHVLALAALVSASPQSRAQETTTPELQGTEGHYCLPDAALYRRIGFFFCAKHLPPPETVRTLAVVGPDRVTVKRALLDAYAWARPASAFAEGHAAEPDVVFVATSARFSGPAVMADLAAQGFTPGRDLRSMITILDANDRTGSSVGGELGRAGPDGRPLILTWEKDDHLSDGAARSFVADQLGVSHILVSPPVKLSGGDYDDRYDPRTFVPAARP